MDIPIRVRLLDREYPLRVAPEDEARMRAVAAYVDERLRAFQKAHPDQTELTATVITALALADELFQAREGSEALRRAVEATAATLDAHLEAALAPPSNGQ